MSLPAFLAAPTDVSVSRAVDEPPTPIANADADADADSRTRKGRGGDETYRHWLPSLAANNLFVARAFYGHPKNMAVGLNVLTRNRERYSGYRFSGTTDG